MSIQTSKLWPGAEGVPLRRLLMAFLLAPLIVGAIVVLMAFLIAGMSEPTSAGVIRVTLDAAGALLPVMFAFMFTFGAVGVLILWVLAQRGMMSWAICGALMGTVASLVVGEGIMGQVERPLLIAAAIAGWTMFLLFRWIAGIRIGNLEIETD